VPTVYADASCRVLFDEGYLPVLISRWEGCITESIARQTFAHMDGLLELARQAGDRIIQVVDATASTRPDALTRKVLAELTDAQLERFADAAFMPVFIAIDSALVRGAVTAVNWISRKPVTTAPVASLGAALGDAVERLTAEGIRPPSGLQPSVYVFPEVDGPSVGSSDLG